MKNLVVAALITICSMSMLTSCKTKTAAVSQVESKELIRTSQSWDGVELPDYFKGRPELVAVKYVFPAGQKLGWHHHPVMNYGILVQGELTIIGQDGKEKVVHEGEPVVYHPSWRESRFKAGYPLYVLSLAERLTSCRTASGNPVEITNPIASCTINHCPTIFCSICYMAE